MPSREFVDLSDRFAARDWALILGTTRARLLQAVGAVGYRVTDVQAYLRDTTRYDGDI